MKLLRFILPLFLMAMVAITGCKKEEIPDVNAGFTVSSNTVTVDEEVIFTNTSGNATAFVWSFGDGTTSTETSPKKAYSTAGVFNVSLSATGAGGTKISNGTITVNPLVAFIVENEGSLQSGSPVQFTNASKGATTYEWNFGDPASSTSTEASPTFVYADGGTYTVTLKATGAGLTSTTTKEIIVTGVANFSDLYFIDYGNSKIKVLSLKSGSTPTDLIDIDGKGGVGLAYDPNGDKIYYSDFENTDDGKIWRMNLDGSGQEMLVSGITDPYTIALNLAGGKIYWADDNGNVSRANLDGSSVETSFINVPDGQMRAVAYDSKNKKIYFYEVWAEDLYVANEDGSNVTKLISGVYGYGILVDEVNDKIYFEDRNSAELKIANLDGTGIATVAPAPSTRIHGLAIDYVTNKLYWMDRNENQLKRANLDGSDLEIVLTGLNSPRGIFIK